MSARGSLRILNFTPWSAKDLDKNVDSPMPGKLLGGDTVDHQYLGLHQSQGHYYLTSKTIRNDVLQASHVVPEANPCQRSSSLIFASTRISHSLPHFEQSEFETKIALELDRQVSKHEKPPI